MGHQADTGCTIRFGLFWSGGIPTVLTNYQ